MQEKNRDNGDLTNLKTINNFSNKFKQEKAHFVTADGGFLWKNESLQEQEIIPLLIGQILTAIKIQKQHGNFVLKIFESYTLTTIKILCILNECYESIYLIKPYTSRISNSEKYVVCIDFKFLENDKMLEKIIKKLEDLLIIINQNKGKYIQVIFPDYNINTDILDTIKIFNISLQNEQLLSINKINNYLSSEFNNESIPDYKIKDLSTNLWFSIFLINNVEFKNLSRSEGTFTMGLASHCINDYVKRVIYNNDLTNINKPKFYL